MGVVFRVVAVVVERGRVGIPTRGAGEGKGAKVGEGESRRQSESGG